MPKCLLEVLARVQRWDLDMALDSRDLVMAQDSRDQAMEGMGLDMVVWEEAMAQVMEAWEEAMALDMVVWEKAMALDMVAWEEAWTTEWEEVMAWKDAARRNMSKVHQILT